MSYLAIYMKLMRRERWDEACGLLEDLMAARPRDAGLPLLCAQAHASGGRLEKALRFAERAEELCRIQESAPREDLGIMWAAVGLSAFLQRRYEHAVFALRKASVLAPEHLETTLHYGLALQQTGKPELAAAQYRQVLAANPDDMRARFNLIVCLLEENAEEAESLLASWPAPAGNSFEYALASAYVWEHKGEYSRALFCLESEDGWTGKELSSDNQALLQGLRGKLLHDLGRGPAALKALAAAVGLAPDSEQSAARLGSMLKSLGRSEDALQSWLDYLERNGPSPLVESLIALDVPPIAASLGEIESVRQRLRLFFQDRAKEIPVFHKPVPDLETPPFFLAFHGRNDRKLLETWAEFLLRHTSIGQGAGCESVHKASHQEENARRRAAALRPPDKRRIAFISRYFTNHTVMSYFFRLLHGLCPRIPRCYFLEFPQPDNAFRRDLAERGTLLTLSGNLSLARKAIAALDLDILVYLDLGMDPLTWRLAFSRLASLQCVMYGHPMTTGIPTVDIFFSPAIMEPPLAAAHYSEALYALPCLLSGFLPVSPPPERKMTRPLRRSLKKTVYLCAQSLFKIHPDMDTALRCILEQDLDGEAQFFLSSREGENRALQNRLRRSLGAVYERVGWLPQCSEEAFIATMSAADAVLDTVHFSGGSTSYKALGAGVPVVTLEGAFMRGRQTAGLYRYLGVEGLTAASLEEYCRIALDLAHSPEKRGSMREALMAAAPGLFAAEDSIAALESVLMGSSFYSST